MPKPRKRTTRGGDPNCTHHFILDRPVWMSDIKFFYEHGVCKLCGAHTEFLRPEFPEFEDTIILAPEEDKLNVRGLETDPPDPD